MWSDGSESDDDSLLDEGLEKEIGERMKEPLNLPAPCPVCYVCKYTFHNFGDFKALRQHALERTRDRSREQVKVKHFHAALVQLIDDQMDVDLPTVAVSMEVESLVGKDDVSIGISQKLDDMKRLDEDVKERKRLIHNMQFQRQKKLRQSCKIHAKLDEVQHHLRICRQRSEQLAKESMKECEKHQADLVTYEEEWSQTLASRHASVAVMEKKLSEGTERMSQKEKMEIADKLMRLTMECKRMEREKDNSQKLYQECVQKKAEAERARNDAIRSAQCFEAEAEALKDMAGMKIEPVDGEENTIEQLRKLGLAEAELPLNCLRCRRRFQSHKDEDNENTICKRIILEHCNCADYCRSCVQYLNICPKHKCPTGNGIVFRTYG